jgi:hypothetical protein
VFTLKKIFFSRTSKPISVKLNFACVYVQNISQYDSGERCGPWASCFIFRSISLTTRIPVRRDKVWVKDRVSVVEESIYEHMTERLNK